jgi:exopolyphosphatase / guanosine-5'-triphosphate,3'-diphosphate pyrophosphatase
VERQRLRRAAALLGDIAWAEHPDYRAEQALRHALFMPAFGVGHAERAFIAAALHARYGAGMTAEPPPVFRLLDDEALAAARAMGLAMRLGYTLGGGIPGQLGGMTLGLGDGTVTLTFASEAAGRYGESVQRRLDALARMMGRRADVKRG